MTALSTQFVERQYNLRAAFPDHGEWFARWGAASAKARSGRRYHADLRYGNGTKQTLDLFPAEAPRGALLFIHGGFWRSLDKSEHSFVASEFTVRGVGVAVINYDLCPGVSVARIVDECREAVAWLHRQGAHYGVPSDRMVVAGHSAGAHLTAMMFATDWSRYGLAADVIAGGLALSGIFDLEPLLQVTFNADLRLDSARAHALSPIHVTPRAHAPLVLAAGADETDEFVRQSWLLWERWPECHPPTMRSPLFIADRHHFSVLGDLAAPKSELFATAMRLFNVS